MAGLFDGLSGNSGILGGLPDWLLNAQAGQGQPMNFADRYANVPPMQNSGMMADPGLQQVSPQAMQAWRQGADQGAPGGAQMPPMAQPVSGQAPPGMPTPQPPQGGGTPPALNGTPTPQMPSMPSFMGSAQTAPSIGDRLGAAGAGFFNAGGPMEAIGNLFGGAMTGQRQDAGGYNRQQTQQAQQAAYQAVKSAGGTEGQALAAASSPEVFKALAPELFGAPKVVQTGESMGGGKQFMLQQGAKFSHIPGTGPLSSAVNAQGEPLQGQEYLDYIKKTDPSAAAEISAILRGDAAVTGRNMQKYMPEAQRVDPTFSQYTYDTRKKTALDFASGGKSANNVKSLETVGGHIDKMADSFDKLGNTWSPDFNSVKNWFAVRLGKGEPNAYGKFLNGVSNELGTVFRSYGMSDAEVKSWRDGMDNATSPEQFKAGMSSLMDMLKTRKEAIVEQYQQGLGKAPSPEMFQKLDASIAKIQGRLSGTETPTESKPSATPTRQLNGKSYYKQNGKWFEGSPPGDTSIPANANFTEGQLPEDSPIRMAMMDSPRSPRPKPQLADQFGGGGGTATSPPGAPALSRAEINKKAFTATDQLRRSLGVTASTPGGRATDEALKAIEEALKLHSDIKPF